MIIQLNFSRYFPQANPFLATGFQTHDLPRPPDSGFASFLTRSVGVSRDQAKVLNYGRIYGAGIPFAKQLLQTFNPALSDSEASR